MSLLRYGRLCQEKININDNTKDYNRVPMDFVGPQIIITVITMIILARTRHNAMNQCVIRIKSLKDEIKMR